MSVRSAALAGLAVLAVAGCKPTVRGRCTTTADCRQGAYCSIPDGICLAASGTCSPPCGSGEICSGTTCAVIQPALSVTAPAGTIISPAFPQLNVHVDAAAAIALHQLALEADLGGKAVATGAIDAPQTGDNLVTITQFVPNNVAGNVSVHATLTYLVPGLTEQTISSVSVPAFIDAQAPTVTVFVPAASDAVGGWVPRTSGDLEVRATVDDGAVYSGAQSAALSFDVCPASAACTYPGTLVSQAGGATIYSFAVPRSVQAAGSEAPLAVTVKAQDVAGNQAQGAGTVQIDDAPPQLGTLALVSTGVTGEDAATWFQGGTGAADVEIAIPVTDSGSGVASLALHLDAADLVGGFTGSLDPAGTLASDGWHFKLPASGVRGREGHLRFTLTALDKLQHATPLGPDDPHTQIQVDALAPTITTPHVVYSSAAPSSACGPADSATFKCGRQAGTHLLADDNVTVTFDAFDCGVGMGDPQNSAAATLAGSQSIATADKSKTGTPCSNGSTDRTHHYAFQLNLGSLGLQYDPPVDTAGTTLVQLTANGVDRFAQATASAANSGASGDGLALVSLWRWRNQVAAGAQPSGSPALIPGNAGSRQVAFGTTLPGTGANLFVLGPDGTTVWTAQVPQQISGDVATGSSGSVYAVSPQASCSSSCSGVLDIIPSPGGGATTATVQACSVANVSFGASPVIAANPERAVVVSTAHFGALQTANVFLFQTSACNSPEADLVSAGDFPGVSASWPSVFLASASQGFTSADRNGGDSAFNAPSSSYSGASAPTAAPPALLGNNPVNAAFFGSLSPDDSVRRASMSTCLTIPCWTDVGGFTPGAAASSVPYTPVFDSTVLYAADDHGKLYAFNRSSGAAAWSADLRSAALPAPWSTLPVAASAIISAPVLLQRATALVVRSDGVVALANSAGISPLLLVGATAAPAPPAIDSHNGSGVAYLADGDGWVTALQLPVAALAPGQNTWPRPGRDSCNSRNAASQCQ